MSARVAVVGLGGMGAAIARRVLAGGFPLAVSNRTPGRGQPLVDQGARWLPDPAGALEEADVCLTSLADDRAVEAVVPGILGNARPGTVLVETSTISLAASRLVAARAAERGVGYVRAPVSGNPGAVEAGTAALFVSGSDDAIDRAAPVLDAVSAKVRRVGEGESARVAKLVLQVLIGGTAELLAESLVLGEAAGLERGTLLDTINASVVGSTFTGYKTGPLLADDYSATFTTAMMLKDIGLVLGLAGESGVELPFTRQLATLLEAACAGGHAGEDFMALKLQLEQQLEERSGS